MGSHSRRPWHNEALGTRWSAAPKLVQCMVTTRCSLSCDHCLSADRAEGSGQDMDLGLALTLMDQLATSWQNQPEVLITGGEPLEYEHLPALVAHAADCGLPYSLNTARKPSGAVFDALEAYPPTFVAVSLDGPAHVHDRFRGREGLFAEALESMEIFSSWGSEVTAGTTLTKVNIGFLEQTLSIVAHSAASAWGLHLLVPEGRARQRPGLFLSRRQLKKLVSFVLRTRRYFPVEMADELGFCGGLEPFLRSLPLRCTAGRWSCVVLPQGAVVPCTTMDESTSAGCLSEASLATIWRDGFGDIRQTKPEGACCSCHYFGGCEGGCWLQRKSNSGCFRHVWEMPATRKAVASYAAAAGLLVSAACAPQSSSPPADPDPPAAPAQDAGAEPVDSDHDGDADETASWPELDADVPIHCDDAGVPRDPESVVSPLEKAIVRWFVGGRNRRPIQAPAGNPQRSVAGGAASTMGDGGAGAGPPPSEDPGWAFAAAFTAGALPAEVAARAQAAADAVERDQPSLALIALAYRSLAESILDGPEPSARTEEQNRALVAALRALSLRSRQWQRHVLACQLDPYLARGRRHRPSFVFASLRTKGGHPLRQRRPRRARERMTQDVAVERWGHGSGQRAEPLDGWLDRHSQGDSIVLTLTTTSGSVQHRARGGRQAPLGTEATSFGVFDLLVTMGDVPCSVDVQQPESEPLSVTLPPSTTITYPDLLRCAYQQHGQRLDRSRDQTLRSRSFPTHHPTDPMLLAPMRAAQGPLDASAARWLADFWLF